MEECLKLVPRNRDRDVGVMSPLVLLPAEADPIPEEGHGKRNLGRPRSSGGSKVVLTLLKEVVVVYVRLSAVYVWGRAFNFFQDTLETTAAGPGAGAGTEMGDRA